MNAEDFLNGGGSAADFLDAKEPVPQLNPMQSATQTASVEPPASLAAMIPLTRDPALGSELKRGFLGQPSQAQGTPESVAYEAGKVGLPTAFSMAGEALGGPPGAGLAAGIGSALQSGARAVARNAGIPGVPEQTLLGAAKDAGTTAATNAAFSLLGKGVAALKPGATRLGAQVMRALGGVPEKAGVAALENPRLLVNPTTEEEVKAAYDAFHTQSGTISRKEFIRKSADPFESVSRAMNDMTEATQKLKNGTLTTQEAVNASQAGRYIRDMKASGNELAREVSQTADDLKSGFDNFIQTSKFPKVEGQQIPIAQRLVPSTRPTEIARELVPGTLRKQSPVAQELVQTGTTNVPTGEMRDILPDLKQLVEVTKQARGQGLYPKAIMTDSEKLLYDKFMAQIESAAEHNVPLESLVTKAEAMQPVSGFAEQPVFGGGKLIYGEKPTLFPGKPVMGSEFSMRPGETINETRLVRTEPGRTGYPQYQEARQLAWQKSVSDEFKSGLPLNRNQTPDALRSTAAAYAAGSGAVQGNPLKLLALPFISPKVYGGLIKAGYYGARAATPLLPYAQAAGANELADYYRSQPSPAR